MTQDEALTILKTGASVFLTGEPGSGKTHTVNAYVSWLRAHGIEPAITASTGIAATHIGGYTIHSWSGIGIKKRLSDYDLDHITQNEKVTQRIRGTNILIIDEISMLSAGTFAMVETVCREVRGDRRPFGGIQVLLVGDFFQLPPIVERVEQEVEQDMFADTLSRAQFAFSSSAWKNLNPITCYLSEQHRQEDGVFLDILSAIRKGVVSTDHREVLASRRAQQATIGRTQLFSHNADVNKINDTELGKIQESTHVFNMVSRGSDKLVEALKRGCLSPEVLVLKVGARVMFTKNDVAGRSFVNGTLGTVTGFAKESGYPIVKTHNGRTLVVEPDEWRIDDGGKTLARINQLPLRLAWAMTVHKSQGMSLDAAHMDLSGAFEYGQGYVALSRVRTLAGLSLAGLNERALEVHPDISAKDQEFHEQSDTAQEVFAKIPPQELAALQYNFIKACGGTVEQVPTKIILETNVSEETPDAEKPNRLEKIRETFPNAYRSWSKEEDEDLKKRFVAGEQGKSLVQVFGRKPGAIRARLIKLGLIEE